jgi:iron complex transport system substrate-binding protein
MGPIRIVPRGRFGDAHRGRIVVAMLAGAIAAGLLGGLQRAGDSEANDTTRPAGAVHPTAASFSPAAEDLIWSMGAGAHLVGVSNFDATPGLEKLPRVGDYQSIDWEKLIGLRPDLLIVQMAADRVPAGLKQRAGELGTSGARVVNVQINSLEDIRQATLQLGAELNETDAAQRATAELNRRLEAVRKRWADQRPVPTLIVLQEQATAAAGPGTFLDEVLSIAGGKNVLTAGPDYPSIDREQMMALSPEVIVQILPGATEPVRSAAEAYWKKLPELAAVREGRVVVIDDPRALMPCSGVAELAEKLASALHPGAAKAASTGPANDSEPATQR